MKPIVLCILDGMGINKEKKGNAYLMANKPNLDYLWNNYPHSYLKASGESVGLPNGQMGNSEVGHVNIGAGRVVYQPLPFINDKIKNKSFFENESILEVINYTVENNSNLHILGLLSDGGIHSHINHLMALIDMADNNKVENLYLHLFLDGRDTLPDIGLSFLKEVEEKLSKINKYSIATVSGRYYAMDRDNRWERIKQSYDAIVNGIGEEYKSAEELIESNLSRSITDEFTIPAIINDEGLIKDNDGLIAFNFRPDRLRQLFSALTNPEFKVFPVKKFNNIKLVTMMPVSNEVISKSAFKLDKLTNTFGEYISNCGLTQLRIAETEKYAHVVYFFDGGLEKEIKGCDKILIPSKKVATYDLEPEMSAYEITVRLLSELDKEKYDVIILNYANGDMVGHTGDIEAAIKAVEAVDECVGKLYEKIKEKNGTMIITSDHGNCEYMIDSEDNAITSHTTNLVPFIITNKKYNLDNGSIGNIAPTMLDMLNIEKPKEMTLNSLILSKDEE